MKTLILGGTTFLGRHLVHQLIERGHDTAIFTRGRANGDDFATLVRYVGDRDGGLAAIPREGWDAVIDTSGYVPAIVAASCAHLVTAKRYAFTSSISVYDSSVETIGDGIAPYVARITDRTDDDSQNYGSSKRRSEDVVRAVFDDRALVVRRDFLSGHTIRPIDLHIGSTVSRMAATSPCRVRRNVSCNSSTSATLRRL